MGLPLIGRPLYGPRKEVLEASLADGRLTTLTPHLLESLGVLQEVVSALSALESNGP